MNGIFRVPQPVNEPVRAYAPGSPEKQSIKGKLAELRAQEIEIPLIIGGEEVRTGRMGTCIVPHRTATCSPVTTRPVRPRSSARSPPPATPTAPGRGCRGTTAPRSSSRPRTCSPARGATRSTPPRCSGQSKTVFQAEIDSACELIDFWRFNPYFAQAIYENQPISSPGMWNHIEYRALEGFVFAVTPFNFTSIAGNLPTAPALMGNTVLWKPASTGVYPAYFNMQLLMAAGLPPGVINFVPGSGGDVGDPVLASPELAGIHFTGSTAVFHEMWKTIGANIATYKGYPRIVGETGGKDFVFAHASAEVDAVATALVRGAFEYQGQKCSAASRAYIPRVALAAGQGRHAGAARPGQDGRPRGLQQLHVRGHRQGRLRDDQGVHRLRQGVERGRDRLRRRLRRLGRLLHRADRGADHQPEVQAACRRRSSDRC